MTFNLKADNRALAGGLPRSRERTVGRRVFDNGEIK
jgi:hypothetical protein